MSRGWSMPGRGTSIADVMPLAALFVTLFAAGCGLRITEVSGTVRIDGKPAKGVQVVFQPEKEGLPRALATTDAAGTYRLVRQGPGNKTGAAAGRYRVRLSADNDDPAAPRIPDRYNVKSDLTYDVKPGSANTFDIDVSTK